MSSIPVDEVTARGSIAARSDRGQHSALPHRDAAGPSSRCDDPLALVFPTPTLRGASIFLAVTHEASNLGELAARGLHLVLRSVLGRMSRG